jgi:2-haloacid dehalogenase
LALNDFKVMSFDCYGTLIDWERGILEALAPMRQSAGHSNSDQEILQAYAAAESDEEERSPGVGYRQILKAVHATLAGQWEHPADEKAGERFASSVSRWPAFPDSSDALDYLTKHYKLVILSNVDGSSFEGSARHLGMKFDAVYTAEDIGSYKPNPANFRYLIDHVRSDFGIEREGILHVAQSLFHDHVPAKEAGMTTVWIDRRADQEGWGATRPPANLPKFDYRFHSMADLAKAHAREIDASSNVTR